MIDPPEHLKKLFLEDSTVEKSWYEQLEDYPNLGRTSWKPSQIFEFEKLADEHVSVCDECQEALNNFSGEEDKVETIAYCPEGEKLENRLIDACHEYSWQSDFDPNWVEVTVLENLASLFSIE